LLRVPDAIAWSHVKVGDRVLFGKFSGSEVKVDGEDYVIMREEEIFAVIQ